MLRTVVLIPEMNADKCRLRASTKHEGAQCSGRTWLYPDGRSVTYATPNQTPLEQPYHLVFDGWGHSLSAREKVQVGMWRGNSL
jgi:hypothetical protein